MFNQYRDFNAKNIFKTFNSHPAYDGRLNGLDVFIMQSDENLQKVMQDAKDMERFYMLSRPEAMELALAKNELNENLDFTDLDLLKLKNWVDEV